MKKLSVLIVSLLQACENKNIQGAKKILTEINNWELMRFPIVDSQEKFVDPEMVDWCSPRNKLQEAIGKLRSIYVTVSSPDSFADVQNYHKKVLEITEKGLVGVIHALESLDKENE
jgi:predicted transcriptional regulator